MVISICKLLENIMSHNEVKGLEYIFGFACVWCIGGGYIERDARDYRKEFSKWFSDEWKKFLKFPSKGTVFDYYVDITAPNPCFEEWTKMATGEIINSIDTSKSISSYTIPTADTISASYLMKQFVQINHCPILVGQAGCGKT
jgi:dynein heavy chain